MIVRSNTETLEHPDTHSVEVYARYNIIHFIVKLREREGQKVDLGRSLKGHLWMVDGGWWISFP